MKIICLRNSSSLGSGSTPEVRVGADSALLREGEPLFLPDHLAPRWKATICPAVRICRLGTSIPLRYAGSYYNAISLMCVLLPEDISAPEPDIYGLMDRAFVPGHWLDYPPEDRESGFSVTADLCKPSGTESLQTTYSMADLNTDAAISALSRYATLKMGDIIIFTGKACGFFPGIGMTVSARFKFPDAPDSQVSLNFKIK